jgi:cell division protease FtsH
MEARQRFSLWYIVAVTLALIAIQSTFFAAHKANVAYSEFKTLLRQRKLGDLIIGGQTISGTVDVQSLDSVLPKERVAVLKGTGKGPHLFVTARVDDPELVRELEAAGIRFTGKVANPWSSMLLGWVLPVLFFFLLWRLMASRMSQQGGLMAIGKSKAKVYVERSTGVTFADVAGIDEARAELVEIVDFLKNPDQYRRLGGKIPKGVLLLGAPGTGKTLLAKAVAGEAKVPFFSLTGSDFVEMFVGVGAARVRDLFVQAQAHAPSIIFIDELDALGRARSASSIIGGHEEREQTLNQLLAEMDGFDTRKGLIIMAATNRPEILDPALLRPGRFDRKVVIDRPDLKGREQILKVHTRGVTLAPEVDLTAVAARTPGFVGADLANLVNEAALRAARAGKGAVEMADFDEAIERVVAGLERKSRVMNPKEKEIVAHHEAGHAVIAESRPHADRVAKVSIIPRGVAALGYTRQQPTDDRYLLTRTELLDRMDVLLGGRAAEELIFGDVSTGAQDDLQRATDLARHMVTRYGMSDTLGPVAFEQLPQSAFLDLPSATAKEYSEDTAQTIDAEIRRLLNAAHERVRATLTARRGALEALAKLLIEREVVDRESLTQLLSASVPRLDRRVQAKSSSSLPGVTV